jgi:hypothetical protein
MEREEIVTHLMKRKTGPEWLLLLLCKGCHMIDEARPKASRL